MTGPSPAVVVLPTYNERPNLAPMVEAVLAQGASFEILVVDDNSPDGTGDLADYIAANNRRVSVLHRAGKQGLGSAYVAGFRWALAAGAQYILEMDADFSHDPADLPRLLTPVLEGAADVSLGSRYAPGGGTRDWPLHRELLSRGGSLFARALLGVPVRDLTGGFKCFHRRVLEGIPLESVQAGGYAFQIELTYRALQAGFRVQEVPIVFSDRRQGKSKISAHEIAEGIRIVWRLRRSGDRKTQRSRSAHRSRE